MMEIRRSASRGHVNHGWLDSHHTFSFGSFRDPHFMGFGPLRVINQDRVSASAGFPTHGHRDMEIISVVVHGALEHRDSSGGGGIIRPGDVQVMSAGRGVRHSEFNHSADDEVRFLQIWIEPRVRGEAPTYQQKTFGQTPGLRCVVSGEGHDGALHIKQNAALWRVLLGPDDRATHTVQRSRAWVQVVAGTLDVSGVRLFAGDGLAVTDTAKLALSAHDSDVEALIFDLP